MPRSTVAIWCRCSCSSAAHFEITPRGVVPFRILAAEVVLAAPRRLRHARSATTQRLRRQRMRLATSDIRFVLVPVLTLKISEDTTEKRTFSCNGLLTMKMRLAFEIVMTTTYDDKYVSSCVFNRKIFNVILFRACSRLLRLQNLTTSASYPPISKNSCTL